MTDVQRYDIDVELLGVVSTYTTAKLRVEESDDGQWVRYEDHRGKVKELESLLAQARAVVRHQDKVLDGVGNPPAAAQVFAQRLRKSHDAILKIQDDLLAEITRIRRGEKDA